MRQWLARFKTHPRQCLSHVVWGFGAGVWGDLEGVAILTGGVVYQFGSAWRKSGGDGRVDTVGLDSVDYVLGYVAGCAVRRFMV